MTLYRLSVHGLQPSGRTWSFRQFYTSGASLATIEADWLSHVNGAWTGGASALQALFPVATTISGTRAASLTVVVFSPTKTRLVETAVATDNTTLPGTSTNPSLPDQNAILVSLRTAVPGRLGRGRTRLAAPDQTFVTAGVLNATQAGHVSTAMDGLRTNMAGSGHTQVLAVERENKHLVPVGTITNVNKVECDRVIRTVRQRMKRERAIYV